MPKVGTPRILLPGDMSALERWWALALGDDGVWPYLGFEPRAVMPVPEADDWLRYVRQCAGSDAAYRDAVWQARGGMPASPP